MRELDPSKDWIDPESDDSSYRRSINTNWRPTRPRSNRRPKGSGKSWSKLTKVQQERIRRLHAVGGGEYGPLKKGHEPVQPLPGSIRSLARMYKVSPRTIQRVINNGRRKADERSNRPRGGADRVKQRKKHERALAIQAVRELLATGARCEAQQLMIQFGIQNGEIDQ